MIRRHNSFVLRCWDTDGDEERVEIEHVQSGDRALLLTLEGAIGWLGARCNLPEGNVIEPATRDARPRDERERRSRRRTTGVSIRST